MGTKEQQISSPKIEQGASRTHILQILEHRQLSGEIKYAPAIEESDKVTIYVTQNDAPNTPESIDAFLTYLTPGHVPSHQQKSYVMEKFYGHDFLVAGASRYENPRARNGSSAKPTVIQYLASPTLVDWAYSRHTNILERRATDDSYTFRPSDDPGLCGITFLDNARPANGNISS